MNDVTTFWAAFWYGVGAGIAFVLVLSAVMTVLYLVSVADRAIDDVPDKLEGAR